MEYQDYFGFALGGEIIFGSGSIKYVTEILQNKFGSKKPLLISDSGVSKAGHIQSVVEDLHRNKIPFEFFDQVEPEPSIENVLQCAEVMSGKDCDSIVALGGGSVIDLSKVISVLLKYGGDIKSYYGQEKIPGETLPIIAIPTTAGTGSEVSAGAILTDLKANTKVGVRSNYLRPKVALIDPLLTLSCPKSVTASAGFDVLAHAVEAYTMNEYTVMPKGTLIFYGTNPITEPLAEAAIKLISQYLRLAVHQGHNREAREKVMMASLLAGISFSNAGVTMTHNITYPVGAKTHAPHGVLLSTLLPTVLEFNLPVRIERLANVAGWMGENVAHFSKREAAGKAIEAMRTLICDIQLPSTLREIGVQEDAIPEMAKIAMPVLQSLPWNPRTVTTDELIGIYKRAY
ncbi:iron-containing alcohol dehydrogenase [bacterium]|nr:MAG: iron-containing alcohol dehydrogenase [bacterium]